MSDFSDRPFVAGSVFGLRSFKVDSLGRLTGVSHARVWTPGENVAECSGYCASSLSSRAALQKAFRTAYTIELHTTDPRESEPAHKIGGVNNQCGYWAYFDGSNSFHDKDQIAAIVEGYGTVSIGTRGFRAEKARIVALVIPDGPERKQWSEMWLWERLRHRLDCSSSVHAGTWGQKHYPTLARRCSLHPDQNRQRVDYDRVRGNYPDVPVFASVESALREFPVAHPEPPEVLTPQTCDDFWTRSAS